MTRRRDREQDGWGGFRGYMTAKVQKLDQQFDEGNQQNSQTAAIFTDVAVFVNGHTDPSAEKLKRLMQQYGGRYVHYYNRSKVTHIIAQNLPLSKQRQLRDEKVVSPQWIVDSVAAGVLLPWTKYQLYAIRERNQKGLDTFLKSNEHREVDEEAENPGNGFHDNGDETPKNGDNEVEFNVDLDADDDSHPQNTDRSPGPMMRAGDRGFLSEFYSRSRLHHLSSWGAEFKEHVNRLRADSDGSFPLREVLRACPRTAEDDEALAEIQRSRVVMHVDMDCFFVSVGLRNRPDLKGKPVAVTHSKGVGSGDGRDGKSSMSMSEIASCSYEARSAGVKNGMFLGRAKELCPDLITIPYDFEGYKSVSQILYDTVAKYTLDIEAVSCDELFVDCTALLQDLNVGPLSFGKHIRAELQRETSCTASCGFGPNLLLARVATRRAKPNGMCWINEEQVMQVMEAYPVRDLPGVGPSLSRRLASLSCEKCGDLQRLSLSTLQRQFGSKTGHTLFQLCRGVDNTPVQSHHERKSISAEVNYGIRFKNMEEFENFLNELANELSHRMKRCRVKGRTITLKLMIRRADQPAETKKFMGHGICKNLAKSVTLPVPTDDPRLISQEALSIARKTSIAAEDVRGMGIQMHKLDTDQKEKRSMSLLSFAKKDAVQKDHSTPKIERKNTNKDIGSMFQQQIEMPTSPVQRNDWVPPKNAMLLEDLPNYSQVNSSFLEAMPEEIRQELGQVLPKNHNKDKESPNQQKAASPAKGRNSSPNKGANRSPGKRGRGRGRGAKADPGMQNQLTLLSMFGDKLKPPVEVSGDDPGVRKMDAETRSTTVSEGKQQSLPDEEDREAEEPSLFGAKTIEEIRIILKDWVEVEPEPLSKDVAYFQSFLLACLPRNLELLCQALSFFCSVCTDPPWQRTYERIENAVQSEMVVIYGGPLKSSVIRQFCEIPDA